MLSKIKGAGPRPVSKLTLSEPRPARSLDKSLVFGKLVLAFSATLSTTSQTPKRLIMRATPSRLLFLSTISDMAVSLSGCGIYVPAKDPLRSDTIDVNGRSREGVMESNLVGNIRCELQNAVYKIDLARLAEDQRSQKQGTHRHYPDFVSRWGTQITLKLTWDEMSGLSPAVSFINPMSMMQSFSLGVGGSAAAHATRVETITFLYENRELLSEEKFDLGHKTPTDCSKRETGIMIDSDLRLGDFIYDKATLAYTGVETNVDPSLQPFSTFQEDITFVGTLSGNITPTWKLTRLSTNTASNLFSATRTTTGDVLVTLGPLATDPKSNDLLHQLADQAASQHNAGVTGGAVASQINSQAH